MLIYPVPWELYLAARARHKHPLLKPSLTTLTEEDAEGEDFSPPTPTPAQSHLHALELTYLSLSILSPLFGSLLLRSVTASFGLTSLSWFSTSLFAFIASLRPWNHLVERLRGHTEGLHDVVGDELGALGGLVEEPEVEDSEEEEREKERQELVEKVKKMECELEEARVATTLMENRIWKLERTTSRDKNKLDALETKYQEILHIISQVQAQMKGRQPTQARLALHLPGLNQKQVRRRKIPNPFFNPLLFISALFWILLTPLASIFPSFASSRHQETYRMGPVSPTSPTSPTHKTRLRLQRTGSSRLETVPETDEEDEEGSESGEVPGAVKSTTTNPETSGDLDVDKDDASTGSSENEFLSLSASTSNSTSSNVNIPGAPLSESTSIPDIVIYTPAKAAYEFVTGILKHGL
jgi:hypothetical protein